MPATAASAAIFFRFIVQPPSYNAVSDDNCVRIAPD